MIKTKRYTVKEIFGPTLQGEGSRAGMSCVFVRFSGCNKWNGKAESKKDSSCYFCDTDFVGGDKLTATQIALNIALLFEKTKTKKEQKKWVILSGGEPMLQIDSELLTELKKDWNIRLAIETNGSIKPREGVIQRLDHITVSPKQPLDTLKLKKADDLKILFPYIHSFNPEKALGEFSARNYYIQPINHMDKVDDLTTRKGVREVLRLGAPWKLSTQLHKLWEVA